MIDSKKLKKIQGILSAKHGAEIPKYQEGAKFKKSNGSTVIYSNNQLDWFYDEAMTQRFTGSPEGFNDLLDETVIVGYRKPLPKIAAPSEVRSPNDGVKKLVNPVAATPKKIQSFGMNVLNEGESEYDKKAKRAELWDKAGQVATEAFTAVGSAIGAQQAATDSNTTKTADTLYDTTAEVVGNLGPYGKIAKTAMQFAGMAGDAIQAMGGGTDQQTKLDQWMDSSFFSWNIGMLNGFAGKNSDSFGVDPNVLAASGGSYGGTVESIQNAASKAGKKYGLFSSGKRKEANAEIAEARSQQNSLGSITSNAADQRLAVQSMGGQQGLAYSLMTDGGYNQKYTYAAKHGGSLNKEEVILEWEPEIRLEWEPQIELNWELPVFKEGGNIDIVEELEWIPEFKSGGKTEEFDIPEVEETTQKNVIPEGALHKNKHHMEHADGLTKKGIPVIDEDGEQQAEIEHSEIIFTLEVTKKLEEYYEIFYSDESSNKEKEQAAIDAGKLLVFQILENTEDRTGLIESCKKGGSLTLKTTTDDLMEEVLEWVPTVVIVEEKEPEEKPKNEDDKNDKELLKEAIKEAIIELLMK